MVSRESHCCLFRSSVYDCLEFLWKNRFSIFVIVRWEESVQMKNIFSPSFFFLLRFIYFLIYFYSKVSYQNWPFYTQNNYVGNIATVQVNHIFTVKLSFFPGNFVHYRAIYYIFGQCRNTSYSTCKQISLQLNLLSARVSEANAVNQTFDRLNEETWIISKKCGISNL